MEPLRTRTNINTVGARGLEPSKRLLGRKALRGVENKVRNVPAKGSFAIKDKTNSKTVNKENAVQSTKIGKLVNVADKKETKGSFAIKDKTNSKTVNEENAVQSMKIGKLVNVADKKETKGSFAIKDKTNSKTVNEENAVQSTKIEKLVNVADKKETKVLDTIVPELLETLPEIDDESHSSKQLPENVENIDAEDIGNPQLVSRYVNDIFRYLRKLEALYPIKKNHLQYQPEITPRMRAVLIDWLVQVHLRFHLLQETLYMTVSVLDRYLQVEYVKRSELQLVGVTSMFIASKFEEMYAPDISDFVYITDNSYSKHDILKMERTMLRKLDFNLSKPLPLHFLRRNSKAGNVDSTMHTLAKYLMEIVLPEYEMVHIQPSLLAAAASYLSLRLLTDNPWSETLSYFSSYTEEQVMPIVKSICKLLLDTESSKLQAIYTKYSSSKLLKISTIPHLKSEAVKDFANL